MTADSNPIGRRFRSGALVFGTWLVFLALQVVVASALRRHGPPNITALAAVDLVIAALWTAFSFAIAVWHERLRTIAPNLLSLVALHVPALIAATLIDTVVSRLAITAFNRPPQLIPFWAYVTYYADFDIISYIAVVAVAEALLVRRALHERQGVAERLEASLSRARLDYLEAQLQPHFLFNSLGVVSELAYDAPAMASRVLRQLTAVFRTALARKSDEVTVGDELIGIEPYLDIQRIRFADWLTIDYHVDDSAVDCLVPRFILQPLVENAIRHGLSGRSAAGTIAISAAVDGDSLLVRVVDNGVGLAAPTSFTGHGIGLTNVRGRLAILYGDDDRLRLTNSMAGGVMAELRIPARRLVHSSATKVPQEQDGIAPMPSDDLRVLSVRPSFRRPVLVIPAIWFLCGLLWTQQSFLYLMLRNRLGDSSWLSIAGTDMTSAFIWAVLTPAVLALSKRFPIRSTNVGWRVFAYFGAGALTTLVHVAALQRLTLPDTPLSSPNWQMSFIVDSMIFCILTAVGHRGVLIDWLRARETSAAALTTELIKAQSRTTQLQHIAPVLLESLDGIGETVGSDPSLTERQLTRLADYLRLALDCTDESGMTPDRERALASAVAALRDSGAYAPTLARSA